MRQLAYIPISAGDSSGSLTSGAIDAEQFYRASVIATFTDNASTGTVKLQASNDAPVGGNMAPFTPTNWADIANATVSVSAGGTVAVPVTELSHRWVRVVFTRSAGAGTLTARLNAQGF